MKADPIEEWRRLTELYRQMGDLELRELAVRPEDLTEVAQQVLRDEMRTRRLDERTSDRRPNGFSAKAVATRGEYETSSSAAHQEDSGLPTEFTWKTLLCECELREQALQLAAALNQAGVESWVQGGTSQYGLPFLRVLVAADELDHAREVAARPIPQQIIDESKEKSRSRSSSCLSALPAVPKTLYSAQSNLSTHGCAKPAVRNGRSWRRDWKAPNEDGPF